MDEDEGYEDEMEDDEGVYDAGSRVGAALFARHRRDGCVGRVSQSNAYSSRSYHNTHHGKYGRRGTTTATTTATSSSNSDVHSNSSKRDGSEHVPSCHQLPLGLAVVVAAVEVAEAGGRPAPVVCPIVVVRRHLF